MGGLNLHGTVSVLETTAAANRAAAVFRPFRNNTGYGASTGVAGLSLLRSSAFLAAEHVGTNYRAGASMGTTTASMSTGGPGTIDTGFTVNRTFVGIALARLNKTAAKLATKLGVGLNVTFTLLYTSAAGMRASSIFAELGEYTVDSTSMGVALAGLLVTAGASLTAVLGLNESLTIASLVAGATSLGAGGENAPLGNRAVSRASSKYAGGGLMLNDSHVIDVLLSGRASLAAELGFHDDALVASLVTSTAALGALGEFTIVGDYAVNWTGMGHTLGIFLNMGTLATTVLGLLSDGTSTFLGARTARFGASGPGAKARHTTVDGAAETVAGLGFFEARAGFAIEGSSNLHTTGTILGAGVT